MRDFGGAKNESDTPDRKVLGTVVEVSAQPATSAATETSVDPVVVAPVAAGDVIVAVAGEESAKDGTTWLLSHRIKMTCLICFACVCFAN